MLGYALKKAGCIRDETIGIGEPADTDAVTGTGSGIDTPPVPSGVTSRETINNFPCQPTFATSSVGEIS